MSEAEFQQYLIRQSRAQSSIILPTDAGKSIPEKDLLTYVRTEATRHGWLLYHTYNSQKSEPGFPDIVAVRPPILLFAELKSSKGKLTKEQVQWMECLKRVSTVYTKIWRPSHMTEIERFFLRD